MITSDDIKLLVAGGEGFNAEFKVSVPSKVKEITEEICAFANAAGGVLLIGVNDTNQIIGVNIDNAKKSSIQHSIGDISPSIPCTLNIVEVDGKNIGVIEVPSGINKPYVLSGAIYVRIGPNSQKLTTAEQMRDFFQLSNKIYFDEKPCPDFDTSSMIDQDFMELYKAVSNISVAVGNEQIFKNLSLLNADHHFKNGAVLFFGKHPEELLDRAFIRCVAFQGTDKRYIIDDQVLQGNLYKQYRQSLIWLRGKLNVRYDIEGQGSGPRKEHWEIPETAFKEAIINALSHRDYDDRGAVIHIEVFDDRVEISNPGGLVSAISDSEFGKKSHSRNPLIFGLFARMHLVEQVGSGIRRIEDLMKSEHLSPPIFRKEGMFTVVFNRPTIINKKTTQKTTHKTSSKTTQKTSQKILDLLKINPLVTRSEIAIFIGNISEEGIKYQLNNLKKKGLIERVGSDKKGSWKVINQ
jgi:ATP-dependent DNA helicase RecG